MVLYVQLPPEKASLFGMLHCALNTTAENLDLITRLGLAKDRRMCKIWEICHLLKISDVRIYDCTIDILDISCLSKIKSPAEETDSYLRILFTRMLYVVQQYLDHPNKNTVTLPSKLPYGISVRLMRPHFTICTKTRPRQSKGGLWFPTQHIHISIHRVNHNQFYCRCLYSTLACACS